jgi:tyrosyl-tRNA synthetase
VYQYFLNTADEDVERYLKLFTLLSFDEIDAIVTQHVEDTAARYGQEQLARYVVTTIFGIQAATQAAAITYVLFGSDDIMSSIAELDDETQSALCDATGGVRLETGTYRAVELAVHAGLANSNGEAKKLIKSGALFVNEDKVEDIRAEIELTDSLLIRKGKKVKVFVQVA